MCVAFFLLVLSGLSGCGHFSFYNLSWDLVLRHCTKQSATMFLLAGLVGCLLSLTAEARVGNCSEMPFFTETSQCLMFKVICKTDTYEARHYDAAKWVSTTESYWSMDIACMRAFTRLYKYISGENEMGQKIQMTTPVVVKMGEKKWFWQTKEFTVSFLLPREHLANPPVPTNDKVFLSESPAQNVYVRSYGGWMNSLSDCHENEALMYDLMKNGASFKEDCHFGVGYNSPWTMFNRHNEVWLMIEDDPVCSSSEELD
ncbi:heme-binding protein 2 [Phyllopteryx taeniolatus]|uniref:heme-binding protein 2 n=1 Tax=Phyllopteryx taeniolatus TaxID=161469 RepID=UPI002AD4089B|nr:heme-binding protein 2 [Phyllopteryx taeniolatus]